jgi:hypothetical protein
MAANMRKVRDRENIVISSLVRFVFFLAIFFLPVVPLRGASSDIDLFVPIAGHGHQTGGRVFDTTLWITNSSNATAHVTLQFLRAQQSNPSPHTTSFTLAGAGTRVFDPIGRDLLGIDEGVGAIRIRSDQPLVAAARAFARVESDPRSRAVATTFNAIPARFAIGNGQNAIAQGVTLDPAAERTRMYVVETAGQPLTYSIAIVGTNGNVLAQKAFYITSLEERSIELGDEFPNIRADHAVARVRGMNGNGRIVFAAAQIARESQDGNTYEMSYVSEPRVRMPLAEIIAYVAVACAVIVAAAVYRR